MVWVKICGVTSVEDAVLVAQAGADALGLNFVEGSARRVAFETARRISATLRGRLELVGVVADMSKRDLVELRAAVGLDTLQFHGSEPPELLASFLPAAYKAVRVANATDVESAAAYAGERVLIDAKVADKLGGTGQRFDWNLARDLVQERAVVVAGGLDPHGVVELVEMLAPYGVDVASGVELDGKVGRKDADRVAAFVAGARAAAGS